MTSSKNSIRAMFDAIAPTYDSLNRLLSLGIDRFWRRRVVALLVRRARAAGFTDNGSRCRVLDVATGTADLAIALAFGLPSAALTGVDISEGMLALGRAKVKRRGLSSRVWLDVGDATSLAFADCSFDFVTVGFGVRNFCDIDAGLREMCRVLASGGRLFVLEFSEPRVPLLGSLYRVYFHRVLPRVGRLVSRDGVAYSYLPRSVDAFPSPAAFCGMLRTAGFSSVRVRGLTFGIARIYEACK